MGVFLLRIIGLTFVLLLAGCGSVFFFPEKVHVMNPSVLSLEYQNLFITGDGPSLNSWLIKSKTGKSKAVVVQLHGNAENMSSHFMNALWLLDHGYDLLTFDYRGFGVSEGKAGLDGASQDVSRVLEYLKNQKKPVVIYAQSIGVPLFLQALNQEHLNIKAIILESGFYSYPMVVREKLQSTWLTYPFSFPIAWLFQEKVDLKKVSRFLNNRAVLLAHARRDEIVSYQHSKKLTKFISGSRLLSFNTAQHAGLFNEAKARQILLNFLEISLANTQK